MDTVWRCTAYDGDGIRRCYGEAPTKNLAAKECSVEILDYIQTRPDLGPLSRWSCKYSKVPYLPQGH
jgi:hypothetical protein